MSMDGVKKPCGSLCFSLETGLTLKKYCGLRACITLYTRNFNGNCDFAQVAGADPGGIGSIAPLKPKK